MDVLGRVAVVAAVCFTGSAQAAEIKVFATGAVQHAVQEIAAAYEKTTGDKVVASFGTAGGVGRKLEAGEPADIVLSSVSGLREVKARLAEGEPVVVGRVRMGMGVKAGAPRPDISTPEKLKDTLLAAPAVAYPDPAQGATTGIHFARILAQMGIAEEIRAKAVLGRDGFDVGKAVAAGRTPIGFTQTTELGAVPGVDVAGVLPEPYQLVSSYAAALTPEGAKSDAVRGLFAALTGPDGKRTFAGQGFEVPN